MSLLVSWKLWAICAAVVTTVGALLIARPWAAIVYRWNLHRNARDRIAAMRAIDDLERKFERAQNFPQPFDLPLSVSATHGHFAGQKAAVGAYSWMHQKLRGSYGLPPRAIEAAPGILSRELVNSSFEEMRQSLVADATRKPRDLAPLAVWLIICGTILSIGAVLLAD